LTRVVDTSTLYTLFDEDDAHHEKAREHLADPEPIQVPRAVLAETIDLVEYQTDHRQASRVLDWLLGRPNVTVAEPVHVPAVRDVYDEAEGSPELHGRDRGPDMPRVGRPSVEPGRADRGTRPLRALMPFVKGEV
jgi:predicted nucleic acid-binding protein